MPDFVSHDPGRDPLPPGFSWPEGFRAAALFTFDMDAEAVLLAHQPRTAAYLDVMAHQRYGPRAAVPRILRMLDRQALRTTFFVPGWVAETYPDLARSVRDAGHEIGHHGYLTSPSAGSTRRPRRATSCAVSRPSTQSSACDRSATGRRRGT